MDIYDIHITINERLIQLIKKMETTDQSEFSDQISTLQVERSQRWADLVQTTTMALSALVDMKRSDVPGHADRLLITKAQKQTLTGWFNEHFPEFSDGTPKDKVTDPARTAQMYFKITDGRKCADE